jgi:predicted AlkP superfamily pyrophosphatase or phosphodiesterase
MILTDIRTQIEKQQRDGFIYPAYENYCFSNIPSAVQYLLGLRKSSPLSGILNKAGISSSKPEKVVVLLIDGFGYNQWMKYAEKYKFLSRFREKGVIAPLTSVFPSTTAAALTTIHSGLTPQEHGLLEWWVYFEEIDRIIKTLPFNPIDSNLQDALASSGVDPRILFSGKTIYEGINKAGISSFSLIKAALKNTTYTKLMCKGSEPVTYSSDRGRVDSLLKIISETSAPLYFNAYWGAIDSAAHDYGVHSKHYIAELDSLFQLLEEEFLKKLPAKAANETVLLVTADHGHINTVPEETIYLNNFPEVTDNFRIGRNGNKILPWGNARDVFITIKKEKLDEVFNFLTDNLGDKAEVMKTEDALKQNLFGHGALHKQFRSRIGDILILPRSNQTIWYEHIKGKKYTMKGMHGGLSPDEMLVPFAVAKASELL